MLVGYARSSTPDQKAGLADQIEELRSTKLAVNGEPPEACSKIFEEVASAKDRDRPVLADLLLWVREGDTVVVTKLDRLARSLQHLIEIMQTLERKKVNLWILAMGLQTNTPTGKLLWQLIGSIAEFERELMLERQRAGVKAAQKAGKFLGQKPRARMHADTIHRLRSDGMSINQIATEVGCHRTSVYRVLKRNDPEGDMASCEAWFRRERAKMPTTNTARVKLSARIVSSS